MRIHIFSQYRRRRRTLRARYRAKQLSRRVRRPFPRRFYRVTVITVEWVTVEAAGFTPTNVFRRGRVFERFNRGAFRLLLLLWWERALVGKWFTVEVVLRVIVQFEWAAFY